MNHDEQAVRERAYALWEKEGSPHGRDAEFWERARQMLHAESEPEITTPLQENGADDPDRDAALADTFPASDPPAAAQPEARKGRARAKK